MLLSSSYSSWIRLRRLASLFLLYGFTAGGVFAGAIANFEAPAAIATWKADAGVQLKIVSSHATTGKRALRVTFPAGAHGAWLDPVKPSDWLSADRFSIDVYNGSQPAIWLVIRVFDAKGKKLEKKEKLFAVVATRVRVTLNQQYWMDLSQVKRIWVGVEKAAGPVELFLDNLRVVSARPELKIGAEGGVIQAEDFTRGRCMINPSGWGERRNDTPIIQSGAGGQPWAEWDFTLTRSGRYQLDIKHAALEPRPCRALMDRHLLESFGLDETTGSWEGFTAKWFPAACLYLSAGKHTLRIDRQSAIPHIDAIRFKPTEQPLHIPAVKSEVSGLLSRSKAIQARMAKLAKQGPGNKHLEERSSRLVRDVKAFWTAPNTLEALDPEIKKLRLRLAGIQREHFRVEAAEQRKVPVAQLRYAVATETSLKKVFPEFDRLTGKPSGRVEIALAANEYESAQIVAVPLAGALRDVRVSVSDLRWTGKGRPELNAVIKRTNIHLYRVGFVEANSGVGTSAPGRRWPDPLLPNAPFDVPADEVRPAWITVHAPKGTPAGVYEGILEVAPKEEEPTRLRLSVKVFRFELANETHVKTTFYLPIRWNAMSRAEVHRWMDYVRPYRIGIMDIGWGWGLQRQPRIRKKADGSYDFSQVDADLEYVFNGDMNSVSLGDTHFSMADKSDAEKEEMVQFLLAYAKHIKSKGWWDRCYYKLPDEPGNSKERLEKVKVVADLVKKADPDYRRLCTVKVREDMFGSVDIWCPLLSWQDDALYAKARARGDQIWMYTCVGPKPPWANIAYIDQEAIAHRILMWTCWRFHYGGYLYWGIKFWPKENFDKAGRSLWPRKPWRARIGRLPAGDGYLSYPGQDGRPIPCIRIELFRDGVEDYEYHYLLEQALGDRRDAEAEKLLNLTYDDEVCPDGLHYNRSPEVLLQRRMALAKAIERWGRNPHRPD